MTDEPTAPAAERLAWLMWCYAEGYTDANDRALSTNWLLDDPATLHPDDVTARADLLHMANEILALLETPAPATEHVRKSTPTGPDYCETCSQAAVEWVDWPCAPAQAAERITKLTLRCGDLRAQRDEARRELGGSDAADPAPTRH